ncbi:MAG TPA: AMP-binding protein [Chloroflexota bacterium]
MRAPDRDAAPRTPALRDLERLNLRDFLEEAARAVPDQPFIIHGEKQISYREFNRRVDHAAAAWHELGVRKGDRVAFVLENRPEFLEAWFGLAKIGGILVAINTRWQLAEVEYFLSLTEPRFVLVGEQFWDVVSGSLTSDPSPREGGLNPSTRLPHSQGERGNWGVRGLTLGDAPHFTNFAALVEKSEPHVPKVELFSDDPISFISTSGTTGRPKAVMQTHGNFVLTGEGYARWVELQPGERIYLCLPLFHINSQAYTTMGAIAARATIVLVQRFSASRFWADMSQYGVNVFNFVGSMLAILLKRDESPEERQHAVRLAYGGPIPADPPREEIERRFGLTLISGIGMSETTYGLIESVHGERRPGSLGKPRQHPDPRLVNEARVVDEKGREVPDGDVGELVFRNPVMMKGYFRHPEQTAETLRDGWLYTGDLVRRDSDGFYYYVDRKKDIVRVRGENVSPAEVEQVLSEHPGVEEAAVIGVPSELTEEEVAAFVVPRSGTNPGSAELVAWCAGRLADFKTPRHLWLVESLPKTETQRTEKHRLREMARERLSAKR